MKTFKARIYIVRNDTNANTFGQHIHNGTGIHTHVHISKPQISNKSSKITKKRNAFHPHAHKDTHTHTHVWKLNFEFFKYSEMTKMRNALGVRKSSMIRRRAFKVWAASSASRQLMLQMVEQRVKSHARCVFFSGVCVIYIYIYIYIMYIYGWCCKWSSNA